MAENRGEPDGADDRGRLTDFRFGAVAVWAGFVGPADVQAALDEQARRREEVKARRGRQAAAKVPKLGEILVTRGLLTGDEVGRILRVQILRHPTEGRTPFGEIAVARRYVAQADLDEALDTQSREVLRGRDARHVKDILVETGRIDPAAVEAVLAFRARADSVPMAEISRARATSGHRKSGPPSGGDAMQPMQAMQAVEAEAPTRLSSSRAAEPPRPPGAPSRSESPNGRDTMLQSPNGRDTPARRRLPAIVMEPRGSVRGTSPPGYLPGGPWGVVSDNCIWIAVGLAAAAAVVFVLLRDVIFG